MKQESLTSNLLAGHSIVENGDAGAKDQDRDASVVEARHVCLALLTLAKDRVVDGRAPHAETGREDVDCKWPHWHLVQNLVCCHEIWSNLSHSSVKKRSFLTHI